MINFYMSVGLPGSGKSNIARKMKEENPKIQEVIGEKNTWGSSNGKEVNF